MNLSPLRSHKDRHNFVDTPSDICHCDQGVENTYQFLLICPTYVTQRATLATSVNEILLKNNLNHLENQSQLYLYGQDSINYADNRNIIISTVKYIKDTRRFSFKSIISHWKCWVWVGGCLCGATLYYFYFLLLFCYCFYHSCAICMCVLY